MREEEVPGGLEVLEVAELDNGASHGSGNPARAPTSPHHTLPHANPRLPQPNPHCFSRAGAGKPNRKLSARSGPPPRSAAHARSEPGAGGWRGPSHVTGGCRGRQRRRGGCRSTFAWALRLHRERSLLFVLALSQR